MPDLSEKESILVTGGNRGIGRAICLELAGAGYGIIFTYNTGSSEADSVREELLGLGTDPLIYRANLTTRTEIENLTRSIRASGRRLFALVNNAGIYRGTRISEVQDEEWEKVLTLNLSAPFYLARNLNDLIVDGGSIINISSVYGIKSDPWAYSYQASKAALIHITRSMAKELAPRLRVNSVAPGYVRTDMNRGGWESEKFSGRIERMTPMARWGEPQDIARAVRFLIDPVNSFITGHTLVVDGGIGL